MGRPVHDTPWSPLEVKGFPCRARLPPERPAQAGGRDAGAVRGKGGEHLFPAVDEFLVSLDPAAGEVRVRPIPGMFTPMENGDEA